MREIATIVVYPPAGRSHSTADDLSTLAGYTRSLLPAPLDEERRRHVVPTNIKNDVPQAFTDSEIEVCDVWEKGRLRLIGQLLGVVRQTPGLKVAAAAPR
jgi:hypothetical protein